MEQTITQDLRIQILLDRKHFSVGEIDGVVGLKTKRAIKAFQEANNLSTSGKIDEATLKALGDDGTNLLTTYTLTAEDVNQPLVPSIPKTMLGMSKLRALSFTSLSEALGEKFQISPKLLTTLNQDVKLIAGAVLTIPIVGEKVITKAAKVIVTKSESSVRLYGSDGKLIAYYPTTLGSSENPPPYGKHSVVSVTKNPYYNYSPERFESPGTTTKVTLPPGPNGPVGLVWIALSIPHYGIHGTPEPSKISQTASHGCIRLTNWDALEVADLVRRGIPVIVQK